MRAVAAGVGNGVVITARGLEDTTPLYAISDLPTRPASPSCTDPLSGGSRDPHGTRGFGVNRTMVQPPRGDIVPLRIRRALAGPNSSETRRSTITFTRDVPAKSLVSFS